MIFPRLVFKDKGPHSRAGGNYSHMQVESEEDFKAAIKSGWFATLPEAIESKREDPEGPDEDNSPPTREEMEIQAQKLGIKVDGRWSDARLMSEIEKAGA